MLHTRLEGKRSLRVLCTVFLGVYVVWTCVLGQQGWGSWLASYGFLSFLPDALSQDSRVVMFTFESLMASSVWPFWHFSPEDRPTRSDETTTLTCCSSHKLWHGIRCQGHTRQDEGGVVLYNHAAKLPLSYKDNMEVADAGNAGPLGHRPWHEGSLTQVHWMYTDRWPQPQSLWARTFSPM